MKANDNIPQDEMLLAEAIAAAKARNLVHARLAPFRRNLWAVRPEEADSCCALGALYLAGRISLLQADGQRDRPADLEYVATGNDAFDGTAWSRRDVDGGESLGWAFRCATTQEDQ